MSGEENAVLGLAADRVRVLPAHLLCIPAAAIFHACTRDPENRKRISAALGVGLVVWCYRWRSLQLFLQWMLAYIMYRSLPHHTVGRYTFIVTFCHVLLANAYSYYYEYGMFPIDYKSSLMLGTMKLSSFAFSVQDGQKPRSSLEEIKLKQLIRDSVSAADHFCYCFSFIGLLFGPFIFYNDHVKFMSHRPRSYNVRRAVSSVLYGVCAAGIFVLAVPEYDVTANSREEVLSSSLVWRHWILYVTMFVARCKYYFVWLTAQSVCLFAGYDSVEAADDELITDTVRPLRIEMATSMKEFVDNWNVFTARWLRFVVYSRVASNKLLLTFVVSAVWHGFYPGYLLMFVPLAFYMLIGQKLHKMVWPRFQTGRGWTVAYLVVCWLGTTVTVMFNGTAFQLIYFKEIMAVQTRLYFYPHVIAALLLIVIKGPSKSNKSAPIRTPNNNLDNHHEHQQ